MHFYSGPRSFARFVIQTLEYKEDAMPRLSEFVFAAFVAVSNSSARSYRPNRAANGFMPLLFTGILLSSPSLAQDDIQRQRKEILADLLAGDRPEIASTQRWICINGNEPSRVREARAMGFDFTPDPSDSCLAALWREAKDHMLAEPYRKLLRQAGGDADLSGTLPKAIGATALSDKSRVSIGNGKAIILTSAMAFDAGFTVAYASGAPNKGGDPEKLKSLAESCLATAKDVGTCFSVGYVYGAQAFNAR
jgi:hypothetical protein